MALFSIQGSITIMIEADEDTDRGTVERTIKAVRTELESHFTKGATVSIILPEHRQRQGELVFDKRAAKAESHHERLRRTAASADARRGTDITHLSHEDRLRLARDL